MDLQTLERIDDCTWTIPKTAGETRSDVRLYGDADLLAPGEDHRHQHHIGRDREEGRFREGHGRHVAHGVAMAGEAQRPIIERAEHRRPLAAPARRG